MRLKNILALLVMAIFVASAAVAQEAAAPVKEEKPKASVSGVLFFDYSYLMSYEEKVADVEEKGQDSINLQRVYVTFANKIDDVWSVKVTLDGGTGENGDVFIKNAYFQMAQKFDPVGLKIQAGVVGTPIVGLLDKLGGQRWIYNNYGADATTDITGKKFDVSSADTGIKADIDIMKMVTITGMYSNADGYKKKTQDQDAVTKAYYSVINITPIKPLNIFGYYHWHDTAGASDENYASYMGGGLAWSDKAIKIGGSYSIYSGKAADVKEEGTVLSFWLNVNLQQFAGMPVLLIGRYAMGTYEKKVTGAKLENEGSTIWAGIGYQANSNVQFALMYNTGALEKKSAGVKDSDAEASTIYLKSEVKF